MVRLPYALDSAASTAALVQGRISWTTRMQDGGRAGGRSAAIRESSRAKPGRSPRPSSGWACRRNGTLHRTDAFSPASRHTGICTTFAARLSRQHPARPLPALPAPIRRLRVEPQVHDGSCITNIYLSDFTWHRLVPVGLERSGVVDPERGGFAMAVWRSRIEDDIAAGTTDHRQPALRCAAAFASGSLDRTEVSSAWT